MTRPMAAHVFVHEERRARSRSSVAASAKPTGSTCVGIRTWMSPSSLSPRGPGVTVRRASARRARTSDRRARPGGRSRSCAARPRCGRPAPLTATISSPVSHARRLRGARLDHDAHARLVGDLLAADEQAEEDEDRREEVVGERPGGDRHDARPERRVRVAAGVLGVVLLVRVHPRDLHVREERDEGDLVDGGAVLGLVLPEVGPKPMLNRTTRMPNCARRSSGRTRGRP